MKLTSVYVKKEDNLNNEDDLKNEYNFKNEYDQNSDDKPKIKTCYLEGVSYIAWKNCL